MYLLHFLFLTGMFSEYGDGGRGGYDDRGAYGGGGGKLLYSLRCFMNIWLFRFGLKVTLSSFFLF